MARRRVQAGITLAGCVVAAALAFACLFGAVLSFGGDGGGQAESPATTTRSARATTAVALPEPPPPPAAPMMLNKGADQGHPAVEVAVGDCVALDESAIEKTACAAGSGYRVADRTPAQAQCPGDADRTYSRSLPGGAREQLCLDINWVVGSCVDLAGAAPRAVDCAAPGRVRVLDIRAGTTDVNTCSAADRGVVYGQRNFVVCVSTR
ncbi:hypothetical protein NDR87_06885 [Nocardia sp. CDC159]|uniref:LppU protein n=1 Tax=Nocardia pulmonis TaxID=2951408 RepID=A0A9X2E6W7_9NOCA|nr:MULTISPECIES: hypothetical protein [Nocardia]MCM6772618.1 hypothetical protein [Nocardia pulmonis]MCM6786079.1 hypothetical protein [Nocardia sp. CDC159]